MAIIMDATPADEVIDLETFRAAVLAKVDPANPYSLTSVANELTALARNQQLLHEAMFVDLQRLEAQDAVVATYTPQSCILDRFGPFIVRANIWPAFGTSGEMTRYEAEALSYFDTHDHNFSFVTTNIYGPGYETDIYNCDTNQLKGEIGESVPMILQCTTQLNKDRIIVFLSKYDIHTQKPPTAISASLNLLINDTPDLHLLNQYHFDPVGRTIVNYVQCAVGKRLGLLEYCNDIHDEQTIALLEQIAQHHPCRFTAKRSAEIAQSLGA